jgi:DNA end-binding protein Ku
MSCHHQEAAMARTIWTGSLSFGLVNIPVGLYTATKDKSIHFNQFEEGTADRIRYKKVNERTGDEVETSRIERGVDIGGGEFVILSDEELDAAAPERSRTIEIDAFVDLGDIDPIYYRTSYYLAPHGDGASKAYELLRSAMRESSRVGIATLVMRGKEYLVAVRPEDDVLALETMYFADEVKDPAKELPELDAHGPISERELDTAKLLIDSMATDWDPTNYRDTYRQRLQALIEEKRQGNEIVIEAAPARATNVVDLMEALQASVAAAQSERAKSEQAQAERPARGRGAKTPARAKPAAPKRTPRAADASAPAKRPATTKRTPAKAAPKRKAS